MYILNKIIFLLFALITESLGIGEEYIDEDEGISYIITNVTAARRTLGNIHVLKPNVSINTALLNYEDMSKDDVPDDHIILSYNIARGKHMHLEKIFTPATEPKALNNANVTLFTKSLLKASQTTSLKHIDSFEEDDYKSVIDSDDLRVLRNQVSHNKLLGMNKTELDAPYAKFYNLEPAIYKDSIFNETHSIINKTWYVPQDFPCWDLPVLYGELGSKKKKQNVFLIYGGDLVNVIEETAKETTKKYKPVEPPISHVINKWCEVEPCYGDHTLCLFPNLVISKICDEEYKVHTPSIVNQFAIVNTINTMRNHVANGVSTKYPHLSTAANMKQVTYDYDLEDMAEAWLRQCLPGSAPCSALNGNAVSHLECTKYAKHCCSHATKKYSNCIPRTECFVYPVIGCIHIWYSSAGKNLVERDVLCGRSSVSTFHTVQLLWAETNKVGCAYGQRSNGDIRVVCNFSPGAPYYLETKLYCGLIAHNDIEELRHNENITDLIYLSSLGIKWRSIVFSPKNVVPKTMQIPSESVLVTESSVITKSEMGSHWGIDSLIKLYKGERVRKQMGDRTNGTRSMTARLVAKYTFIDESEARCDSGEAIYIPGSPGSMCVEKGRPYHGLCYDFRDPTPGYRLIVIAAAIALFSLILYDLFSGVVRQTNN